MIKNTTKGTEIAEFITFCRNPWSRSKGLMFEPSLMARGYIFEFKKDILGAIHMLFVFFPIDIVWLDENKKVVELKENIKAFSLGTVPKNKCRFFIELPTETIKEAKIEVGDQISWSKK